MKTYDAILFCFLFFCLGCSSETDDNQNPEEEQTETNLYFPPNESAEWENSSPASLGWDGSQEENLREFLDQNDTKAFIILKDGKIAVEWYFDDHTQNTSWYWASAGKTLTAFTVGLAQEENLLDIDDSTSSYLDAGWTSLSPEKEDLITIKHQLNMTTGMDDTQGDCKDPECLTYVADAGTRWSYHNAPYTLLQDVVANAASQEWSAFFNTNLRDRIGMDGFWFSTNDLNNVFFSTARSMARFGLLNLNGGIWNGNTILADTDYFRDMKTTSQELNPSYGYLWWLNGKDGYRLPQTQIPFNGSMIPNAPNDMYSGLGKNDQKLYVCPGDGIVIVRMGNDSGEGLAAASSFDNQLWEYINAYIN
ncbi:Beta-lactamase [Croceitalea dokdonensis DOKDO 023]|uniref:Beta-lactamase n=1 Tax=Croceitalea dokdonensis DOKDO 023 TaxID=1300341 RepID=A0A0N8H3V0_9FLAO|nr:serine hydrolase [Croceitalea dokdonensis]KPM31588.1 Beta-lactamase [Croceitalea dokdonensis DOKDO 023]